MKKLASFGKNSEDVATLGPQRCLPAVAGAEQGHLPRLGLSSTASTPSWPRPPGCCVWSPLLHSLLWEALSCRPPHLSFTSGAREHFKEKQSFLLWNISNTKAYYIEEWTHIHLLPYFNNYPLLTSLAVFFLPTAQIILKQSHNFIINHIIHRHYE